MLGHCLIQKLISVHFALDEVKHILESGDDLMLLKFGKCPIKLLLILHMNKLIVIKVIDLHGDSQ